jgi:hypothetical protein
MATAEQRQVYEPLELPLKFPESRPAPKPGNLAQELAEFQEFGQKTCQLVTPFLTAEGSRRKVPTFVNEFWTARQRQANAIHEISYRACFKPQLPRFFIERLTAPGDRVYDPFMGRGTTLIEAALLGRVPLGNDINPLSIFLTRPRLAPPTQAEVEARLGQIPMDQPGEMPEDLLVFYHPDTLRQISSLRRYLLERQANGHAEAVDDWIAMVALNRLTGHSKGFFSVYTMPPNQAVSIKSQRKINERRKQQPPPRDVPKIIRKKSRSLLQDLSPALRSQLRNLSRQALLLTGSAAATKAIESNSVALVVTSPPFLNVVQYATDNWLRCWFMGIAPESVPLTVPSRLDAWQAAMTEVFCELRRVLQPGGHIAFEVGEVHKGQTTLENAVLTCGTAAGLIPLLVMINDQIFTKTANCWGIDNMSKGTNTNRIVVFRKA